MKAYFQRPINEEFEDSYAQAGLQPSTGQRGVIQHTWVEYANKTGNTTQQNGKAIKNTGRNLERAGKALSRTGMGAVVGVPMAAAGKAMRQTGVLVQAAGRTSGSTRSRLLNATTGDATTNPLKAAANIQDRIKATRVSITILSWATPLWFTIQLPLALIGVIFLGASATAVEWIEYIKSFPGFIPTRMGYAGVNWVSQELFGLNLDPYLDPSAITEQLTSGMLEVLHLVVFFIGVGTLIAMGIIYAISGIKGFFGEGSHLKGPIFCLAVVGYLFPFTNIFPLFILWALVVWRYPN